VDLNNRDDQRFKVALCGGVGRLAGGFSGHDRGQSGSGQKTLSFRF
jgi:hypothetical protein